MPALYSPQKRAAVFWSRVDRSGGDDACWPYTGSLNQKGYGQVVVPGETKVHAHRFAYTLIRGEAPGLVIDHLCRNRACCNPAHLEAVTQRENILRGISPTAENARKIYCKRGHLLEGRNRQGERACRHCKNEKQNSRRLAERLAGIHRSHR